METVRPARTEDATAIRALGLSDSAFRVSERIAFYELEELVEWAESPRDNLLFVADADGELTGFFFCKIMSQHWAMLDNFYVVPTRRSTRTVSKLRDALLDALRDRGIVYLSTLAAREDAALQRTLEHFGFQHSKSYEWLEMFIADA